MAARAATRFIEIAAASLGVSGRQVRDFHGAASSAQRFELGLLIVNERDDRVPIRVAQVKRRHTLVWTSVAKQGSDPVATRVLGDQLRARQVWPGFSPRGIAPVAKAALRGEYQLASLNLFDWVRLWGQCLRPRPRSWALRRIARLSFALTRGRLRNNDAGGNQGGDGDPDDFLHPLSNTVEIRGGMQIDDSRQQENKVRFRAIGGLSKRLVLALCRSSTLSTLLL